MKKDDFNQLCRDIHRKHSFLSRDWSQKESYSSHMDWYQFRDAFVELLKSLKETDIKKLTNPF